MGLKGLGKRLRNLPIYADVFFRDLTTFGGTAFFVLVSLLVLILIKEPLFSKLLLGFFFSLAIVVIIRFIYFKERPLRQEYTNLIERIDASSFPSWHSARIVFLALTFIYFWDNFWVTSVLTLLALLVAYSRIHLQKHDLYDVIGGIILGMVTYGITLLI